MAKKIFLLLIAALATFPPAALAYLPPAFYVYAHIADQRAKIPTPSLQISVSRPMGAGTEETLGTISVANWAPSEGGWPALSLLFSGDGDALIQSVTAFGIAVSKEADLLRASKEQIAAMKEPPRPFYKSDKRMSLKRHRQTYAWVNKANDKSIWVEKDTFLPLKIEAPCPEAVVTLSWAKPGKNICELEFRNVYSLRRGNPQNSRLSLWKDGEPMLFLSFERIVPPKANGAPGLTAEAKVSPEISSIIETILH